MITKISTYILPMAASLAVALSGCGGGGGSSSGGSSGGGAVPMAPVTRTQALENSETVAASVADAIGRAADAQPRPGSVTQSSEVDNNNITTDQVEITARYTQDAEILQVRNGTTWSIDTDEGNARQIPDVTPPWYGAELSKRIEGGVLYVDLYSDIEDPTEVTTGGTVTSTVPDTDYLAGGVWLIVPDDATSANDYVFGAFADGNDPFRQSNLTALQGTATYDGDATGVYSEKMSGSTIIGYFDGDVRLTANFDGGENDRGTISGSITNFEVDGDSVDGRLDLGTANIGSAKSGFFRGEVTGFDNDRNYNGHWGGQFFGNAEADGKPGSVAGTFGGRSTDNAVNFVGAFGAHKQ